MTELKPCPFCGSKAAKLSERDSYEKSARVECPRCGAKIFRRDFTSAAAADECVRVWNNRVSDVQDIRHGLWEMNFDEMKPRCSYCGREALKRIMSPFCPYCGARMDNIPDYLSEEE